MQRQKIRPSYADLQRLGDDEEPDDGEGSGDDVPEYAPAATAYRGVPPPVICTTGQGSSSSDEMETGGRSKAKKVVRIASSSSSSISATNGASKADSRDAETERRPTHQRVRIDDKDREAGSSDAKAGPSVIPLIGTIHERSGISTTARVTSKKVSRFASARSKDSSGELVTQAPDVKKSDPTEEVWLDEEGQPMSAFRKARLASQGKAPPSKAEARSAPVKHPPSIGLPSASLVSAPSMSALMASISVQNDAKVSGMSAEEVQESLLELERTFGEATLQKLKLRRAGQKVMADSSARDIGSLEHAAASKGRVSKEPLDEQSPEHIRAKYFPHEASELPASLRWMKEGEEEAGTDSTNTDALRFDFSGKVMGKGESQSAETRLAGLHHHGTQQDRAGYTTDELLHLARSTLSSQSIVALQTIERIASTYVQILPGRKVSQQADSDLIAVRLVEDNVRGKAALISSWYIEDRQVSLRASALRCLRACLFTSLAGPSPVPCVVTAAREQGKKMGAASGPSSINVLSEEFALGLIPSIGNLMAQHGLPANEVETCLELTAFLSKRSTNVCSALVRHRGCLSSLGKYLSAPSVSNSGKPEGDALTMMLCLLSSSRSNALSLVEQGYVDTLLRFIAIPPWQVADEKHRRDAWTHLDLVMQVYTALAKYGLYSDLPAKAYALLPQLLEWVGGDRDQSNQRSEEELSALASTLRCLNGWVVCAIDPHQTQGHHDIGWSQVSEWWERTYKCVQNLHSQVGATITGELISAAADAIALLDTWTGCAEAYQQIDENQRQSIRQIEPLIKNSADILCSSITNAVEQVSKTNCSPLDPVPVWRTCLSDVQNLAELARAGSKGIAAAKKRGLLLPLQSLFETAMVLTSSKIWIVLKREDARLAGGERLRLDISLFCCDALLARDREGVKACDVMRLLALLGPGQEDMSLHLINESLPTILPELTPSDLRTIRPFTSELVRPIRQRIVGLPSEATSESLCKTQTLFVNVFEEEIPEDDSIDPLSGAPLWKSANAGLPLRADWPLAALDDLLHSGTCASLNRKDALGSDWDANEVQIVTSALSVAAHLYQGASAADDDCKDVLPSAAELHLAIMKVFMLEEVQAQDGKASGLITGKDLFRNSEIVSLLERLFEVSKHCRGGDEEDDMEKAIERQNGGSLPFYQFYTSFFGLYDSISFGMELFGRALLLPQTKEYAEDYRRLLWLDYAHCLGTIKTSLQLDPRADLSAYLVEDDMVKTKDTIAILQAMMTALHSNVITRDRNELLWSIAIQQIGFSLWYSQYLSEEIRRSLAKMLLASNSREGEKRDELVYDAILRFKRQQDRESMPGREDIDQRRQWLEETEAVKSA